MLIYWELFWSFAQVGIFCVGGGYASMPLIQAQVIEQHQWLSMKEFVDIFTISQMTPGPIGINAATFVGNKIAGVGGAVAATIGFVAPSIIIILILSKLYFKYGNIGTIKGILNGLRPAVVALIGSAGAGIFCLAIWNKEKPPYLLSEIDVIACVIFLLSVAAIQSKKLGTIQVLLLSGVFGFCFYSLI